MYCAFWSQEGYDGETFSQANIFSFNSDSDMASSPEPEEPLTPPPDNPLANALSDAYAATQVPHALNLKRYERTKPEYEFPPSNRTRRPNGRVPKHKSRVYVRSEVCPADAHPTLHWNLKICLYHSLLSRSCV